MTVLFAVFGSAVVVVTRATIDAFPLPLSLVTMVTGACAPDASVPSGQVTTRVEDA